MDGLFISGIRLAMLAFKHYVELLSCTVWLLLNAEAAISNSQAVRSQAATCNVGAAICYIHNISPAIYI